MTGYKSMLRGQRARGRWAVVLSVATALGVLGAGMVWAACTYPVTIYPQGPCEGGGDACGLTCCGFGEACCNLACCAGTCDDGNGQCVPNMTTGGSSSSGGPSCTPAGQGCQSGPNDLCCPGTECWDGSCASCQVNQAICSESQPCCTGLTCDVTGLCFAETQSPCTDATQCLGNTTGASACVGGTCCQRLGQTCKSDNDCCGQAPGSCSAGTCQCAADLPGFCKTPCTVPNGCDADGVPDTCTPEMSMPCSSPTRYEDMSGNTVSCYNGPPSSGHTVCTFGGITCVATEGFDFCDQNTLGATLPAPPMGVGGYCGGGSGQACTPALPCRPGYFCDPSSGNTCQLDPSCTASHVCWTPSQDECCYTGVTEHEFCQ